MEHFQEGYLARFSKKESRMKNNNNNNEYNTQRTCGVWLIYIGLIIIVSAMTGGELFIQPFILGFGYFIGYFLIYILPFVNRKLSYGPQSKFQDKMDNLSVLLVIILCTFCGLFIGFNDLRLLWLCIFIAVGIHFFGFYFSQGKLLLVLGILTILNSIFGILFTNIPFLLFAGIDGLIKMIIGLKLLSMRRQSTSSPYDITNN